MSSPAVSSEFRTSDLALAAVLHLSEFKHLRMEIIDRKNAVWVFSSDEELLEVVDDYQDGVSQVEPRDFMKAVAAVRNELYAMLDGHSS